MATNPKVFQITCQPGIRRDGTVFDGNIYNDGQWVRFQRGRPKKMGGYREITADFTTPVRGAYVWSRQDLNAVYGTSSSKVEMVLVDQNGVGNSIVDRTPVGFTASDNYVWQIDSMYDAAVGSDKTLIFAHPGDNLTNIDSTTDTPVYYADAATDVVFTAIPDLSVSGGVVCIAPYLVYYGSDGLVGWSNANEPRTLDSGDAGTARVTGAKVVKGLPYRGGGQSPAALLWSLDSLIRMSYVGGNDVFRFDTISSQSSILSSSSVIEYDGVYYWVGVDRFLMYNGAVRELPNDFNQNWFFDNLNYKQRQKVWAMKVPRFGEIWWFFPYGEATECTNAVIFNTRLNCWYDVELARSAGFYSQVFRLPVMFDAAENDTGGCSAWAHEVGTDRVSGDFSLAIESFVETADFGWPSGGADSEKPVGDNRWTRLIRVEPDFIITGNMNCYVTGKEFAQADDVVSAAYPFDSTTTKIDMREQRREIRLKFESNEAGGHFEAGKILLHLELGDIRS